MLETISLPDRNSGESSGDRLLKIWSERYLPNLATLSLNNSSLIDQFIKSSEIQSRTETAQKIRRFLYFDCELAALRANTLFADEPNIVNLREVKRLSEFVRQVYNKILEVYQQMHPPVSTVESPDLLRHLLRYQETLLPKVSTVHQLAQALNPVLEQLQREHLTAKDPRTIGFVTTQFHFSTEEILKRLSPIEQILISPYFKFAEEQVCIPWQQICAAANQQATDAARLNLVSRFLSQSQSIAASVYDQAIHLYPTTESRRGSIRDVMVRSSIIRDCVMMQAYLGLCILEGNMGSIEHKLLPLCLMVFPQVGVKWGFVQQGLALLIEAIERQLPHEHILLLNPYSQSMQQIFALQ